MAAHSLPRTPSRSRETYAYAVSAIVFSGAAAITWISCRGMQGGMAMPGGWTMSMAWMPMGSEATSALLFAGMWGAMMVAMMLPSAMPIILIYRRAARFCGEEHAGALSAAMAGGYFGVWTAFGMLAYPAGLGIARLAMGSGAFSRAVPVMTGMALIAAGVYQLSPWKAACLKHCRDPLSVVATHLHRGWRGALRLGVHHGAFCIACCWALMLMQLALGVMDLLVMIAVALVIALEKLLPRGIAVSYASGILAIAGGLVIAGRAFLG